MRKSDAGRIYRRLAVLFRTVSTAFAVALTLGAIETATAASSNYPDRPVRIIVPAPPGGGSDTFARLIAQHLQEELKQPFVIENRPGGGTFIGMDAVVRSPPDGYTLYLSPSTTTSIHLVRKNMPFDVRKALAPVTQIAVLPYALVVHKNVPAKTVSELVELAKRSPQKLSYGSAGVGTGPHMAMALFNHMAGIDIQHIPYSGVAQGVTDILGERVSGMMLNVVTAAPHIEKGTMRALGVTSSQPTAAMPDVPPIAKSVPDYEALQWFALMAPGGTPKPILNRLQQLIAEGMKKPEVQKQLKNAGAEAVANTPDEFAKVIDREIETWSKLAEAIKLTPK